MYACICIWIRVAIALQGLVCDRVTNSMRNVNDHIHHSNLQIRKYHEFNLNQQCRDVNGLSIKITHVVAKILTYIIGFETIQLHN